MRQIYVFQQKNGNINVSVQASLCSSSIPSNEFNPRSVKPSRIRRRQRRKERRENHSSASSNLNVTHVLIQPPQINLLNSTPKIPPDDQILVLPSVPCHVDVAVQTHNSFKDTSCNTEPTKSVTLTTSVNPSISISPQNIYHPAIINACKRHPRELTKEEFKAFNQYLHKMRANGQPVELDPVYLPTNMHDCLHCGHQT